MKILILIAAALSWSAVYLVNMPVNTWLQIPNSQLSSVAPSAAQYPNIQGVEGVSGVIDDWCGGILDSKRNRLIVWGGGHNGYYGNEVYAFDVGTQQWARLTNPTANPTMCTDGYSDGTPSSKHTYGTNVYIAQADRMFNCGGCNACPAGGCGAKKTFTFDFASLTWHNMSPSGTGPGTCCNDFAAYDTLNKKVYYWDASAWACGTSTYGLYAYDYTANSWLKVNSDMVNGSSIVDPKRHLLFNIGAGPSGSTNYVTAYTLGTTPPVRQVWTTTGGDAFITQGAIGLAYDPVVDKYVGWKGGAVYALDPVSKAWTSYNPAGGPPGNVNGVTNGVWGRWQYVPSVNAYITVVSVTGNVYAYKLTAGMGVEHKTATLASATLSVSPNPFRTGVKITLPEPANSKQTARVGIYDVRGNRVFETHSGESTVVWEAGKLPGGIYLIRADINGKTVNRRISLLK
jgi:hypothetical protein